MNRVEKWFREAAGVPELERRIELLEHGADIDLEAVKWEKYVNENLPTYWYAEEIKDNFTATVIPKHLNGTSVVAQRLADFWENFNHLSMTTNDEGDIEIYVEGYAGDDYDIHPEDQ